jgi:sialic acid synthase SpsE
MVTRRFGVIIAEAGVNHNGNLETAKKLVKVASEAGADAVKFQTFWNIELLKKYELSKKEFLVLKEYCDSKGILFLSTPHTFEAIHFLDELIPVYKIASTYLPNINFLREVANKNKPILLSTGSLVHDNGMATDEEIGNALKFIPDAKVTLLHCVSKYPCVNPMYERVSELSKFNCSVGISDHSMNIKLPRGLEIYEKHIMLENQRCVDENVSLRPKQFKEMIEWLHYL